MNKTATTVDAAGKSYVEAVLAALPALLGNGIVGLTLTLNPKDWVVLWTHGSLPPFITVMPSDKVEPGRAYLGSPAATVEIVRLGQ